MVQHAYGWVPPQAMTEIGQFLKITPAEVLDTASFYEEYALTPQGRSLRRSLTPLYRWAEKEWSAAR